MSVVTIDVQTKYWSWDDCGFSWNDANRTWDTAYDRFYTLSVSEELGAADIVKKAVLFPSKDGFKITSTFVKTSQFKRGLLETSRIIDINNKMMAKRNKEETFLIDKSIRGFEFIKTQGLNVAELKTSFDAEVGFEEILSWSETYWDNASFCINTSEAFGISESDSRRNVFDRTIGDVLEVSEGLNRVLDVKLFDALKTKDYLHRSMSYTQKAFETFRVSSSSWRKTRQNINDAFGAGETFDQPKLAKGFYEKVNFLEGFSWQIAIRHSDGFGFKEMFEKSANFIRKPIEKFELVEKENKDISIQKYVDVDFKEVLSKGLKREFSDNLGVLEYECKSIEFDNNENIVTKEKQFKNIKHTLVDIIGVDDWNFNQFGHYNGENLELVDGNSNQFVQELTETASLTDLLANNAKHSIKEIEVGFVDDHDRKVTYNRNSVDMVCFVDNATKNIKYLLEDDIRLVDEFNRITLFVRALKDKLSISETYWDNIMFYLQVLESCVLSDEITRNVYKDVDDKLTVKDVLKKRNELFEQERAISILEGFTKALLFKRNPVERVSVLDKKLGSDIKAVRKDAVNVGEVLGKNFVRGYEFENFGVDDVSRNSIHYLRGGNELLGVSDVKLGSKISKVPLEEIVIKGEMFKLLQTPIIELLTCDDEIGRQVIFATVIREALNLIDSQAKSINRVVGEKLRTRDNIKKLLEQFTPEGFVLADALIREYIARRLLGENITVDDYLLKGVGCFMSEEMNTYDTLIKACEGILSNISVTEGELTLDDFLEIVDKPPNYTKFIDFKVGEYEYKDALIRLTMKTKVKQTQPVASNVVMHVDIPDTDDRGEIEISDTTLPTKVYFNKFYYNPPEVNVTLKAGNAADGVLIPNIVTTEGKDDKGRYFEVEIWNESWSERKTGRLGWVSKGY